MAFLLLTHVGNRSKLMKTLLLGLAFSTMAAYATDSFQLGFPGHPGGKPGHIPGKPHPGKPFPHKPFPPKPPMGPAIYVANNLYAAQMSLVHQLNGGDGFLARRIFESTFFRDGDRLILDRAYGVSIDRIKDGKVYSAVQCPRNWLIHFTDRFGRIIGYEDRLECYLGFPVFIPRDAVAAYIGYADTAYFDNEGKRWAKYGSTQGCSFQFRIVR